MDSLQAESEEKQEMDDSGCIQDETPPSKGYANVVQEVSLLDLSDDVLLMILKHLAPRDLKALGFTCPRLGALILDRSLWLIVDGRAQPWGRTRFRWFLTHALHEGTRELLIAGYAREARECLGHVSQTREDIEANKVLMGDKDNGREEDNNNQPENGDRSQRIIDVPALGPNAHLYIDDHRQGITETYAWPRACDPQAAGGTCAGPQFSLTPRTLRQLADTCPALASLALEHCNIDCDCTSIGMFPPTLKTLSLRGSKCYNLPLDRSFLFKIQDAMPNLESLDVSECEWMEPATLLPLSKLPTLKHLYARDCLRLTEFVAYASLATRYGFTNLESLDLRGSPVGDSEVSALGWLAHLRRLWLSPARAAPAPPPPQHSHLRRAGLPSPVEPSDRWEEQEPEYFKIKEADCESTGTSEKSSNENKHTWQARVNGNSSDYTSTIPTVLSSSTISSPTMIINASPMRPGTSNDSAASGSSNSSKTDSFDSSRAENTSSSTIITASIRPGPSNDVSGSSNDPTAAKSSSNPTMIIHASPARPGSSNDSTITPITLSPSISITRSYPSPKCCNIITPYSSLHLRRPAYVSKAPKRKNVNPSPGSAKRKRDDDSSTDDDDVPLNSLVKQNVNEGASTSKDAEENEEEDDGQEEEEAQPRHHVLYVNVGQRLHAVYRLSLDNEHIVSLNRNSNANRSRSRSIFMSPPGGHIDASSLVTDSAIRRFGRADGEDINYVHIGPNGPYPGAQVPGARPDRSSLTHLTVTGFRTITDRSLEHLATSAPLLRSLDLSETNVTDAGVATFRSLRPDCEVIYSKFEEKD